MAKTKPQDSDGLPNVGADASTQLTPAANNSAKEAAAKVEAGEFQLPLVDNSQAKENQKQELKEAAAKGETVKVQKPKKDANGMVIGFVEIEVPIEQAKAQFVPGGLTAQASYVETNARLQ